MQFHGGGGSSAVMTLSGGEENFQEGEVDSFPVTLHPSLLPLHTLTLSHNNAGTYSEWHVDTVAVENGRTGEKYTFKCGR